MRRELNGLAFRKILLDLIGPEGQTALLMTLPLAKIAEGDDHFGIDERETRTLRLHDAESEAAFSGDLDAPKMVLLMKLAQGGQREQGGGPRHAARQRFVGREERREILFHDQFHSNSSIEFAGLLETAGREFG